MLKLGNNKHIFQNVNLQTDSLSPGRLRTLSDNKGLHFDFSIVSWHFVDTLDSLKSKTFVEKFTNDVQLVDVTLTILTMHLMLHKYFEQ